MMNSSPRSIDGKSCSRSLKDRRRVGASLSTKKTCSTSTTAQWEAHHRPRHRPPPLLHLPLEAGLGSSVVALDPGREGPALGLTPRGSRHLRLHNSPPGRLPQRRAGSTNRSGFCIKPAWGVPHKCAPRISCVLNRRDGSSMTKTSPGRLSRTPRGYARDGKRTHKHHRHGTATDQFRFRWFTGNARTRGSHLGSAR